MTKLRVQWRITGLDNIVVTPEKKVYQLPYETSGRTYTVHEGKNYYRINKKRYSEQKLHALTYESIETLDINDPTVTSLPFSGVNKQENKSDGQQ